MKTNRRKFIKQSVLVAAATAVSKSLLAATGSAQITGVQLYSIRDEMKQDPLGTLKQLSAMGYRYVEHANYNDRKFYGWSAGDFKKVLGDLGMSMPSGHTVLNKAHWDESKKDFTD